MARVAIIPAQASWRSDFEKLKAILLKVAPPGARLHHIGSTAIVGLQAKDIIDLQLTVETPDDVNDQALSSAGFTRVMD